MRCYLSTTVWVKVGLQPVAKVLETLRYFGLDGLSVILCLWPPPPPKPSLPPPPLIIVASNTRPCSKLGGTTLNGREEGSQNKKIISQTGDQQRFEARKVAFWSESLKILQLVVAAVSGSSTVRGKVKLLVSYFTVDVLCNDDDRPLPSYKTLTFKLKASAQYFP